MFVTGKCSLSALPLKSLAEWICWSKLYDEWGLRSLTHAYIYVFMLVKSH